MMLWLTDFTRLTSAKGKRRATTWPALVEELAEDPPVRARKRDIAGLSLATFAGDHRKDENVEQVVAVGLDFDKNVDWDALLERFDRVDSFLHTTWSSTPEVPRARLFLLLSRPVSGAEYRRVYAACVGAPSCRGLTVDRAASDPSRFWYRPALQPGATYAYSIGRGRPVNVDRALAITKPVPRLTPARVEIANASRYAKGALQRAVDAVVNAANGERNRTLNREAWSISRFVDKGELRVEDVIASFAEAAHAAGLGRVEAEKTIASALRGRRAS